MTMRSMPPASSHLAERPVPAPPPTIGSLRAIMPRNFSKMSLRAILGMRSASISIDEVKEGLHERRREGGIVEVVRQADDLAPLGLAHGRLERLEESGVGGGIVERLARHIEQRHAALRDQEPHRAIHAVQLLA